MDKEVEGGVTQMRKIFNEVNVTEYVFKWNRFEIIAWDMDRHCDRDLEICSNSFTTKESGCYEYHWKLKFSYKAYSADDKFSLCLESSAFHGADDNNKVCINLAIQLRRSDSHEHECEVRFFSSRTQAKNEFLDLDELGDIFDVYLCDDSVTHLNYAYNIVLNMKLIWRDLSNLNTDFEKLYIKQDMTDFSFVFKNNKEIKAHKLILMARSPVFKAMFQSNMLESKKNKVEIHDIDPEIFEILLNYIYTGKMKLTSYDNLIDLIVAADKYALNNFKDYCENELSKQLNIENVADNLIASDQLNLKCLKTKAIEFISSKKEEFLKTDSYENLVKNHVNLIIEMFEKL